MVKVITSKDILDRTVNIYFEKNCSVKEAMEIAKKELNISDKDIRKIVIV